jgi:hypothetical protein
MIALAAAVLVVIGLTTMALFEIRRQKKDKSRNNT